ncbi:MAG: hypothetical protein H7144_12305 [Burkholderiales bacterium]|nr:hypothetical protein [Phycisphaerae bacterium]
MGALTGGLLPLLMLRTRLKNLALLERQQLSLMMELLDDVLSPEKTDALAGAIDRTPPRSWLSVATMLLLIGAAVATGVMLGTGGWSEAQLRRLLVPSPYVETRIELISIAMLILAYMLTHLQINHHRRSLRSIASTFAAATGGRFPEIVLPALGLGVRPIHLALGIVLAMLGKFWGLPMMLAWGAIESLVLDSERQFRRSLAVQLTTLCGQAPAIAHEAVCRNINCANPMAVDAVSCPVCGDQTAMR